jgi:hypothetical protein
MKENACQDRTRYDCTFLFLDVDVLEQIYLGMLAT